MCLPPIYWIQSDTNILEIFTTQILEMIYHQDFGKGFVFPPPTSWKMDKDSVVVFTTNILGKNGGIQQQTERG